MCFRDNMTAELINRDVKLPRESASPGIILRYIYLQHTIYNILNIFFQPGMTVLSCLSFLVDLSNFEIVKLLEDL